MARLQVTEVWAAEAEIMAKPKPLALWNAVRRLVAFGIVHLRQPQRLVLGHPAPHALAPHGKRAALDLRAHEIHHGRFIQTKLQLYGLKRRAVFPRHFDDAGNILWRQRREF